jgi:hypothetical protein
MSIFRLAYLHALIALLSVHGYAQTQSEIVGPARSCRNEIGQLEISYNVRTRFTNAMQVEVTVKIRTAKNSSFLLFSGNETTNPASAVSKSSPDSVDTPKTRTLLFKPGEHTEWSAVATVTVAERGSSGRLPKAGHYFLLPIPDLELVGYPTFQDELLQESLLIPLTIEEPRSHVPACRR